MLKDFQGSRNSWTQRRLCGCRREDTCGKHRVSSKWKTVDICHGLCRSWAAFAANQSLLRGSQPQTILTTEQILSKTILRAWLVPVYFRIGNEMTLSFWMTFLRMTFDDWFSVDRRLYSRFLTGFMLISFAQGIFSWHCHNKTPRTADSPRSVACSMQWHTGRLSSLFRHVVRCVICFLPLRHETSCEGLPRLLGILQTFRCQCCWWLNLTNPVFPHQRQFEEVAWYRAISGLGMRWLSSVLQRGALCDVLSSLEASELPRGDIQAPAVLMTQFDKAFLPSHNSMCTHTHTHTHTDIYIYIHIHIHTHIYI